MQALVLALLIQILVVEYLIEKFGFEPLLAILHDLGEGVYINDAIERHAAPLAELETAFSAFVEEQAKALGPGVDWSAPDLESLLAGRGGAESLQRWVDENPQNIRGLTAYALLLMQLERWEDAKVPLRRIMELYPGDTGPESAAMSTRWRV